MKIAMLSEWWDPLIWWWQLYAKYLCNFLVKKYWCTIDIFTRKFIDQDKIAHTKNEVLVPWKLHLFRVGPLTTFFSLLGRIWWLCTMTFFLYKKAKKEQYDIIHAHALSPGLPAKIVGMLCKIPVVYTVHWTMQMDTKRKWFLYYVEKFFVTKIVYDLQISVSHNIFKYPNKNKKVIVIPPAVDHTRFETSSPPPKYPGNNFLFVGRLDRQKWLEYLLEGISNMDKGFLRKKRFHLNIVGDWNLKEKLLYLIDTYTIGEFITMKGNFYGDEIVKEFQKNQVFILPSLAEWQPVVVFEAFLSKLPVIATDVWDNKYFIKDYENGFLLPPGDSIALQKAIEKILNMDVKALETMGNKWYDIAIHGHTRDKIGTEIYEQYLTLLK